MTDDKMPNVMLGKKEYPVPELSARRIIKFSAIVLKISSWNPATLTEDEMTKLYESVFIGVEPGTPTMTFDAFMDIPITFSQLIDAVHVVGTQAGMEFKVKAAGEAAGEAAPATPSIPSVSGPDGTT